jgi:hypothetical protein
MVSTRYDDQKHFSVYDFSLMFSVLGIGSFFYNTAVTP